MGSTLHNCVNCGGKNAAFEFLSDHAASSYDFYSPARCGVCGKVTLFLVRMRSSGHGPAKAASDGIEHIMDCWPKSDALRIAENVPERVLRPLTEAEKAFRAGLFSAAGACYRKAMERSVKEIDPSAKGMLNARIRSVEKAKKLPESMIELLDQVRLFGNEAMHEDDLDPTKEDCEAARDFAHLFLTYAFSLPAMIDVAKQKVDKTGHA